MSGRDPAPWRASPDFRDGTRVGRYYSSYHESYHGQVTKLGGRRVGDSDLRVGVLHVQAQRAADDATLVVASDDLDCTDATEADAATPTSTPTA